jgi:glycosyltransferase involved in cell wall biosynthesis
MKISCIVPAYNEAGRIAHVIQSIRGHDLIDEIIVVNDGSTDDTQQVLEHETGITLIRHPVNQGKTAAVVTGLQTARNDLVIMLDADLIGLEHKNITALAMPVIEGRADMTLSMRKNSMGIYKWLGIDFVSGERVFDKHLIGDLEQLRHISGYGLEVFLNNIVVNHHLRLKVVDWPNVAITLKQQKLGWWRGTIADMRMIRQVVSVSGTWQTLRQIFRMRRLMV